jgi:hypothetical protein
MQHRTLCILALTFLAGCAATPEQAMQQTDWNICRATMGGVNQRVADNERRRRGLDCTPLYPAIAARMQAENEAIANFQRSIQPQPVTGGGFLARSYTSGFNRICIYNRLGNEYAVNVPATAICPLMAP